MKKVLTAILVAAMCLLTAVEAGAQRRGTARALDRQEPRDFKVIVRDTLGNRLPGVEVLAFDREGLNRPADATRSGRGDHFFRIRDSDTLTLYALDQVFRVPVEGLDSLLIMNLVTAPDSVHYFEPIFVTGRRSQRVNTGYGTISPENITGMANIVDMGYAHLYPDLESYLPGRLGAGVVWNGGNPKLSGAAMLPMLVVINGIADEEPGALPRALENKLITIENIASIVIDKVGTIYGTRGANGVMIITTK